MVLHVSGVEFIGVGHGGGQFATHFRLTADGNGTRLIGRLCCDIKAVAVVGLIMQTVIAVFDMDADFFACVFRAQGVGFLCRPLHSHAVNQPLIADAAVGYGVGIAHVRGQLVAHFRLAADGDAALAVGVVRVVIYAQGEGFFDAQAARVGRGDGEADALLRGVVNVHTVFEFEDAVGGDFEALVAQCVAVAVPGVGVNSLHRADGKAIFALVDVVLLLAIDGRQSLIQLDVCRRMIFRRGIQRIVFDLQGEGFAEAQAAVIGRCDGQGYALFVGIIDMLPDFQFQRAIGADFKALVADGVAVFVLPIRVIGTQPADFRTVLAFGDGRVIQPDVCRCMVDGINVADPGRHFH